MVYSLAARNVTVFVNTHYMEEAEYCGRVGIMRDGKLLEMDTPGNLKRTVIPGLVWELHVEPLQEGLEACGRCNDILGVGLTGDHLRVIARRDLSEKQLCLGVRTNGLSVLALERGEPTLEDVFLTLATG